MKSDRNPGRALARALAAACLVFAVSARADDIKIDSETFEGLRARSIGPGVMGGRIAAIDAVPGDRLTVWVGSAGGGVWKSGDGGLTWKPVFDKYNQSIGAIRVSPRDPKTVWVGTGESWVRNSVSVGDGIYKTTDGGDSWTRMGLEKTERIARIVVNPQHQDTVYVAATGGAWSSNPERGLYRTRDGGKTWDRVLFVNDDTGCADVAMDPQNPNVLYAAMWQYRRKPWTFNSGGPGSGLYRSNDGGDTWKKLTQGLPEGDLGRIGIAVSPARPSTVFALVEAKKTAFYRSDDLGEHWIALNSGAGVTLRPFYFGYVVADPKDFNRVYKPGLNLMASDDGGKTFSAIGGSVHSDWHALWIDPRNPEQLICGTDGGVYFSYDRGTNWRAVGNLPVGQFYHVSYDMRWPYNVYGGLQDNGSWTGPSRKSGGIANRDWRNLGGGDGFWGFPDPNDNDIAFVEYQGGSMLRVRQSTGETKEIKPFRKADEPEYRWNWNSPIHMSASKPGTMYFGSQFLFRSADRGDTWDRISPDLTTNDKTKEQQDKSGGLSLDNSSAENHCTIYAISESPRDANTVWVGTDDGNVQVTRDGGKTWTNVTRNVTGVTPFAGVSYLDASHVDAGTCYVTFDGHGLGDMKSYVYKTSDYGKTWQALATDALRGYAHVVREDLVNPDLLFVGTECGLFASLDGGKQWAPIKSGLPPVAVRDLAIHPREHDLMIATHGRGIYIIDDLTPLRSLTAQTLTADAAFLSSRPSVLITPSSQQRFQGDTEYEGDSPDESAVISYYLKKRHIFGDVNLGVYDTDGKLLKTLPGSKRRGINRVEWPMRLKGPKLPPAANLVPQRFAFMGPRAQEGSYTVKLIRDKQTLESKVVLVGDPSSTHTADDRAVQQKTAFALYHMLENLTFVSENLADLRDQAQARAAGLKKGDALATRLGATGDKFESLRASLAASREGRLTGEEKLREKMGTLYGAVNGYDGKPTNSQLSFMGVLEGELKKATADYEALSTKELPAINVALAGRKLDTLKALSRDEWDKKQDQAGSATVSKMLEFLGERVGDDD
jgi:photosystem II stability/assembly factor-like uncharacterized protein